MRFQMSETLKALLRILLLLASAGLPYYFRFVLGMEVALSDLLYAPIILAVLWWPTGGTIVALSLSLILLISHLFIEPATPLLHDLQRSLTLFAIALVMSALSRQAKEAEQEIRQRSQELSALNAIASTASRSLDLGEILEVTFDKVLETMGAEAGGIYLLDEGGKRLVAKVHRGLSPELVKETMSWDEGLAGQVLRSGEPIVVEDISKEPGLTRRAAKGEGFRSYISVPLKSKDKVLGVMDVITRSPRRFAPRDVELLTSIGNQIGVAIENARLFEETRRRLQESTVLFQVGKALTSVLDLERLLQLIIHSAVETISPAESGVIHLLDEASGELHPKALAGKALGALRETKMRIGKGIAGLAIEEGETINVPDTNADPRFLRLEGPQEFKSLLVAPLLIGENRIGTISVDSGEMDAFGPDDERLLTTLASQAAIAIENARLFDDLNKAYKELATAQAQLFQSAKLSAIGELAAGVAHEISNPLTTIIGDVQLLLREMKPGQPGYESAKAIERAGWRANKVIRNLLSFSRREEYDFALTDVNDTIESALSLIAYQIERANIRLDKDLASALPLVQASAHHLEEVWINLLLNARDAIPKGQEGEIHIASRLDEQNRFIKVLVSDNGCGISPEHLERLFEPFFTTKDPGKGTGLGLYISYNIIEQHHGSIQVESEVGKGTTFTITLPTME